MAHEASGEASGRSTQTAVGNTAADSLNARQSALSFGALLRKYRLAAGLSQEELAERAGISLYSIGNLERGVTTKPRKDTVQLLAQALGLSESEATIFARSVHRSRTPQNQHSPDLPGELEDRREASSSFPSFGLPALPGYPGAHSLVPLVGRAEDIARVGELLLRPTVRLLTLVGAPGVGKTRLGMQVAREVTSQFADGMRSVSLAPLDHADQVASALARALEIPESGTQPLLETLCARLSERHLLLLLDNFEQVGAAAPLVADLLEACPLLTILCTSRTPLHLRGEYEYVVAPLPLPNLQALPDLATLAQEPAMALFVGAVQRAVPRFVLTRENAAIVASICATLDGVPLALELAAPRLKLLSPDLLLAQLRRDPFPLLGQGPVDLPARQQTIERTLHWSYHLLTSAAQQLLRALGAFRGGATLDAITAVYTSIVGIADMLPKSEQLASSELNTLAFDLPTPEQCEQTPSLAPMTPQATTLALLEELLNHQLIQRRLASTGEQREDEEVEARSRGSSPAGDASEAGSLGGEIRIDLLYVVREFAARLLQCDPHTPGTTRGVAHHRDKREETGESASHETSHDATNEAARVYRAHALYYLHLAETAAPQLTGPEQQVWLRALDQDYHNLRAALVWTVHQPPARLDSLDNLEAEPAEASVQFSAVLPDSVLGLRLANALWRFWYQHGYLAEGRHWLEHAIGQVTRLVTEVTGISGITKTGQAVGAMKATEDAEVSAATGTTEATGTTKTTEQWQVLAPTAVVERFPAWLAKLYAKALNGVGVLAFRQADYAAAQHYTEQCYELTSLLTDDPACARVLVNLGNIANHQGEYAHALTYYEEGRTLLHAQQDRFGEATVLFNIAGVLSDRGDYQQAQQMEEEALQLRRAIGDTAGIAASLAHLGTLANIRQDYQQALAYLHECRRLCLSIGYTTKAAYAQYHIAVALLEQGQYALAQREASEAAEHLLAMGESRNYLFAMLVLGSIAYAQAQYDEAVTHYERALASARLAGEQASIMQALVYLGTARRAQGAWRQALRCYHESLTLAQTLGRRSLVALCIEEVAAILCAASREHSEHSERAESVLLLSDEASERRPTDSFNRNPTVMNAAPLAVPRSTQPPQTIQPDVAMATIMEYSTESPCVALGISAARLLGAAARLRHDLHEPVSPIMRANLERTQRLAAACCHDRARFAVAWEEGHLLSFEQCTTEALTRIDELLTTPVAIWRSDMTER